MRKSLSVAVALVVGLAAVPRAHAQPPQPPRGFLGVVVDPEQAESRVVVLQVPPDSPAAKAGLKAGDVINKVDGKDVRNAEAFVDALAGRKPGDKVALQITREGKDHEISATLTERPERRAEQPRSPLPREVPDPLARLRGAYLGISMQELTPQLKNQLNLEADKGVVVTDVAPDSPAAKAHLKVDDVITALNDKPVSHPNELRRAILDSGAGKEVTLKVMRGTEKMEVKAQLAEAPQEGVFRLPRGEGRLPPIDMERIMPFAEARKVQELEKKVQELEKRIQDLEKKLERK
jgi:serine protease Do